MNVFNRLARRLFCARVARPVPGRVAVLCYHSVHPDLGYRSASPAEFDEQIEWLGEHCSVVPLRSVVAGLGRARTNDRVEVAITFDDGYADNYHHALPALIKHGFVATFFVTSGFVARDPQVLAYLRKLRATDDPIDPMSWEQIRALASAGMEIGAHTHSHPNLTEITLSELSRELGDSRKALEDQLGVPVTGMAYPFGKPRRHFNRRVIRAVQDAGYDYAAAAFSRGVRVGDSPYSFPRFFATRDSIGSLSDKISGVWDRLGWIQEHTPAWLLRMMSGTRF